MNAESNLLQTRMLFGLALMVLDLSLKPLGGAENSNFSDANWSSMASFAGANGPVYAAVVDGAGNLYIGGDFTVVGDVIANNIAKWDGTNWSALDSGVNGDLRAMAVSGSDLYVGGWFTTAGGVLATNIARWNGSSWGALGSGLDSYVLALAVSGGDVYAGGYFTTAGGNEAYFIAKWSGSSWNALGSGMNSYVYTLAVSGSDIYAGGLFTTAGSVAAHHIAKWNGSSWSSLGSGIDTPPDDLYTSVSALAVSGNSLYAGGRFTTAGGIAATNIAKWNGNSWSALGSAMSGQVHALAASGSDLYTGASFVEANGAIDGHHIAKWNGSSWSALGSGVKFRRGEMGDFPVVALAVFGSDVYAGGWFTNAGSTAANNIAKWDGTNWSALGFSSGMNGDVWGLAASGKDVYAGGDFTAVGGVPANYAAKWNGTGWSALGSGMNFPVSALAVSGSNVYAGGHFTMAGGVAAANIAKWDGTNWSALGSGVYGHNSIQGPTVFALAVCGSDLYVGGLFTMAGDIQANNIAKWNGSSWSALGPGLDAVGCCDGYGVFALALSGNDLYAGGYFDVTTAEGTIVANVAKWDGTNWSALAWGPLRPTPRRIVNALAVSGNELYASDLHGIVGKWNGSNWSQLEGFSSGGCFSQPCAALAVSGNDLYSSGTYGISKWNGSSWTALGSGVNGGVRALVISGNDLYAGGYFTTAGGKVAAYIARAYLLDLPMLSVRQSGAEVMVSWPSTATFDFSLEQVGALSGPRNWVPNTATITDDGTTKSVTIPAANSPHYFRLRRP